MVLLRERGGGDTGMKSNEMGKYHLCQTIFGMECTPNIPHSLPIWSLAGLFWSTLKNYENRGRDGSSDKVFFSANVTIMKVIMAIMSRPKLMLS